MRTEANSARARCMSNPFTPHKAGSRGKCWRQKVVGAIQTLLIYVEVILFWHFWSGNFEVELIN